MVLAKHPFPPFCPAGDHGNTRAGADYGRVMAQTGQAGWQSAAGIAAGVNVSYGGAQLDAQISRARPLWRHCPHRTPCFPCAWDISSDLLRQSLDGKEIQ